MDDILLLAAIERYLHGDMDAAERDYFETLRKNTPEIDQMVVEHGMFLHQMDIYALHRNLRTSLQLSHAKLLERGDINGTTGRHAVMGLKGSNGFCGERAIVSIDFPLVQPH